jgi:hypothetical protein
VLQKEHQGNWSVIVNYADDSREIPTIESYDTGHRLGATVLTAANSTALYDQAEHVIQKAFHDQAVGIEGVV